MYEIVIGRSKTDQERFGLKGTILLGRHFVKMGQTMSLSNDIFLDVNRSHVVFVAGKRGSGKSYTMGVIAEGIADLEPEIAENTSVLIFDTMGIYWTMKYPNYKDVDLLREWKLEGKALDISLFVPAGFFKEYKDRGVPVDYSFSIKPSELSPADWCLTFGLDINSPPGVLISRIVHGLKEKKLDYSLKDIVSAVQADQRSDESVKHIVENQFLNACGWGLFSVKGTLLRDLVSPGKVSVLDISCYAMLSGASGTRALVIGLIAQKLFLGRMAARKKEEYQAVHKATHYFAEEEAGETMPLVWLVVDEAHEFLPNEGKTTASDALITILREGREPGISLVLATQQPGKIHSDVMTQSDVVISHRLTARIDTEALGALMQSYMRKGLDQEIDALPRVKGAGIVFDDMNERMFPMRVRPRLTWHGGEAPVAIKEIKKEFGL